MHRYQHTLDLLRQVIEKAPRFFPVGKKHEMEDTLRKFEQDPNISLAAIEEAIISFGKEIWPYRKAFWHVHDTDGRLDENEYLKEALSPDLQEKYKEFLRKGHQVQDIRRGGEFEEFFTPEEKSLFIKAKLDAHNRVVEEIEELCTGVHKEVCTNSLEKYKKEQEKIEELIQQLKGFASRSDKWRPEILNKVKIFEAGWSGLEKEISLSDVQGEIDYYTGIIELFE